MYMYILAILSSRMKRKFSKVFLNAIYLIGCCKIDLTQCRAQV